MRIAPGLLSALALLSMIPAVPGGPAGAQEFRIGTVVDNMLGESGDTPQARLIFQQKESELCVLIAIPPDPKALRAQLFRFSKRIEGRRRLESLKFKLPKKPLQPEGHEDRVQVWETCLASEASNLFSSREFIDIQYRDPRILAKTAEYSLAYPTPESPQGIDVHKDSAGNLLFKAYDATRDLEG